MGEERRKREQKRERKNKERVRERDNVKQLVSGHTNYRTFQIPHSQTVSTTHITTLISKPHTHPPSAHTQTHK